MEIPGSKPGSAHAVTGLRAPPQWQVGQQLAATVLENTTGRLLLAIGHRQVSARTSLPFEPGQALTLEVRSLGEQPLLRIISTLAESPVATAIRALLPRQGALAPLLASLAALARQTPAPVPAPVQEALRTLLTQLPSAQSLTSAPGLKTAFRNSGLFLEPQLAADTGARTLNLAGDYKANLVRLINQLQAWPGGTQNTASSGTGARGGGAAAATGTPATPAPVAGGPTAHPGATGNPPPPGGGNAPAPGTDAGQTPPAATPEQVRRTLQAAVAAPGVRSHTPGTAAATPTPGQTPAPGLPAGTAGASPPPPFPGTVPLPQAAVEASLALANRLGNLRADLLLQAETALARVQLAQLAAVPREADRSLIEWLFDIPVRHGEDIDIWSARLKRDARDKDHKRGQRSAQWTVQLAFDLPGLGPMQAQIQLHGERVSTHFWTLDTDTLPLVREHLHELRQALLGAGLEVAEVDCQAGRIPDTVQPPQPPLINEKA